ncbi:hypothetical protein A2U01_0079607, partial [Trifolium medium]|nr:hypothetical protein [Trifolium medium]
MMERWTRKNMLLSLLFGYPNSSSAQ